MSGRDWPADPTDPECPHCGEPVSATAQYCMHCEADLPGGAVDSATTAAADSSRSAHRRDEPDPGMPTADTPEQYSGWLHPDGIVDNVSTATVGVVAGFLDGFVLLLLGLWAFPRTLQSSWAPGVAIVGWLLATGWIAWTRTVFGAIRKAAYSLSLLVGLVPLFVAYALGDPDALLFGIVLWPVAGVVAAVGWLAGRGAIEEDG